MNKKDLCPHCGQAIMKNRHSFHRTLGHTLLKVADKFGSNQPFHLQRDIDLTRNEYNNFQKLRYWGLAEKKYALGIRQSGYWILTPLVYKFIRGEAKIPRSVTTFNNKVLEESNDELIYLIQAVGSYDVPEIWADRAESIQGDQQTMFEINK